MRFLLTKNLGYGFVPLTNEERCCLTVPGQRVDTFYGELNRTYIENINGRPFIDRNKMPANGSEGHG